MKLTKPLLFISCILIICSCSKHPKQASTHDNQSTNIKSEQFNFNQAREEQNFANYINALKVYAKDQGINESTITIAFTDVYYVEHVINADKNQPEKKSP